jgi:Flp pilus assembly protein TadG
VLVEAALIIPVIVVLTLAFIQFSSMYFTRHAMVHAAREGARALAVQDGTPAEAEARTLEVLEMHFGEENPILQDFQITATEAASDGTITVAIPADDASIIGDPFGFVPDDNPVAARAMMRDEER